MIILYILLPILFITALLMLRIRFTVSCSGEVMLTLNILFFRIRLYPAKPKKLNISDYKYKKFKRKLKKQRKKALKLKLKEKKKGVKKKEAQPQVGIPQLIDQLKMIISLVEIFFIRFMRHLKIEVTRLKISVSCDNPAKTAIMYGVVSQLAAYLLELLDNITTVKANHRASSEQDENVSVAADFLSNKTTYDIYIVFSIRIVHLLDIALRLTYNYLKKKHLTKMPSSEGVNN